MRRLTLNERPGWRARADELGFTFHHVDGRRYWDERAAYAFTLGEIEDGLEAPAAEIHQMCLSLVDEVVKSERLMERLAIPTEHRDYVAGTWAEKAPSLYGRFDFAYDGEGPAKLFEYNADTPTSIYETAVVQWVWLEDLMKSGAMPASADQFNSLHDKLRDRFKALFPNGGFVHFACDPDSVEDRQTVRYLEDLATQAGIEPQFTPMEKIGLDADGRFVDADNYIVGAIFKLYPWEEMLREPYAAKLPTAKAQFIEPAWKSILSNKGLLPLLWERHAGHPNLLPAFFENDARATELGKSYVRKPLFSREGANIELVDKGRRAAVLDQGYGAEGHIRQALHPMKRFDGNYPILGAWMVGDEAVALGIREDRNRVTRNLSRYVPHVILD